MTNRWLVLLAVVLGTVVTTARAHAQGAVGASITGIVRDASGAVLPGVTVEASSPALIEKVRTAVTDGTGRFQVVGLLPGAYSVTFSLTGFSTVKRDGIQLSGSLSATVDAELRLGSIEETINVTGESPIVDVQSVKQQRVVDQDTINAIPGSRMYHNLVVLVPGIQTGGQNVGGINGPAPLLVAANGGPASEGRINVDGLGVNGSSGGGSLYVADTANVSEVTIDITGGLGEAEVGGPVINVVPRTGGNIFSGSFFAAGANGAMQGGNFDQELVAAGLREAGKLKKMWDLNGAFGGPIKKDKLWFFATTRYQGTQRYVAGMYYNLNAGNPNAWTYSPDQSRQAISDGVWDNTAARVTWQASLRNKIGFFWDEQDMCRNCWGGGTATVSPEAQDGSQNINWMRAYQVSYTSPISNRLLLEAGFGATAFDYGNPREGFDRNMVRVTEQAGAIPNLTYRSMFWDQVVSKTPRYRTFLTYVTGSHNAKVGFDAIHAISNRNYQRGDGLTYRLNNGVPNQLTMIINDFTEEAHVRNTAIFVQDRWTVKRFTLQGGVRYERASSSSPDQTIGPSRFIPDAIFFPAQSLVPGYSNVTFRGGLAMDVFGDQKTSLKINVGRYLEPAQYAGIYVDTNPARRMLGGGVPPQTTRNWNDANRDYVPNCDLLNSAANGECGAMANTSFGKVQNPSSTYDPALLEGWGVRPGNFQVGVTLQRQLMARMSIEGGYNRRWFDPFSITDNRAVTPANYDGYSIPVPNDPRLPNGGGYVIGDLFDINPTAFGRTDNYITLTENYGKAQNYWHGFNVQVNARLSNSLTLQGGTNTGRAVTDNCQLAIDNPSLRNCRAVLPFLTDIRGLATYTVPKIDVQVSGTLQSRPGPEIPATWNVPSAVVALSLGRPLAGNAANVPVNILNPGELYGDRITQVDMRFAKL
ncbi:MAG TPA: carboxypeptidase regulatory-like domain-containing protein, partial [Vicinamibacterales bacterium]